MHAPLLRRRQSLGEQGGGVRSYSLVREGDGRSAEIDWEDGKDVNWLKLSIREAFNISEGFTFLLRDEDGNTVVISQALPAGSYSLVELHCVETVGGLAGRSDQHDGDGEDCVDNATHNAGSIAAAGTAAKDGEGENFEQNLLRIACADAMIANERTYLAWTRTSLSIMLSCFTFTFLDDWSSRPMHTKILSNMAVIFFALAFLGCFLVGYVRYRMFARLLRTGAFSSSFSELDVDWSWSQVAWVWATGITLAFASFVFLGVIKRDFFATTT